MRPPPPGGGLSATETVRSLVPGLLEEAGSAFIPCHCIHKITITMTNMAAPPQHWKKKILHPTNGKDQLGAAVGCPQPGDVAKIHVRGIFTEYNVPFCWGLSRRSVVTTEFLDTHRIGDTAFVRLSIPAANANSTSKPQEPTLQDILIDAVQSMTLGESATVTYTTASEGILLAKHCLHKGQYQDVPSGVPVELQVDLFRIARGQETEHRRPTRNGLGGHSYYSLG